VSGTTWKARAQPPSPPTSAARLSGSDPLIERSIICHNACFASGCTSSLFQLRALTVLRIRFFTAPHRTRNRAGGVRRPRRWWWCDRSFVRSYQLILRYEGELNTFFATSQDITQIFRVAPLKLAVPALLCSSPNADCALQVSPRTRTHSLAFFCAREPPFRSEHTRALSSPPHSVSLLHSSCA
jgi:hypothetical protein